MADSRALFLFVTASGEARAAGDLVRGALAIGWEVYAVASPNVQAVASPQRLFAVPGCHWIRDYGEPPLDRFPFGTMLVAPCTFNTLNKVALGLADNLLTAMLADALGAGRPLVVAPAMNWGLWHHPQTRRSLAQLDEWGCRVVPPTVEDGRVTMADLPTILAHLGIPGASSIEQRMAPDTKP